MPIEPKKIERMLDLNKLYVATSNLCQKSSKKNIVDYFKHRANCVSKYGGVVAQSSVKRAMDDNLVT